MRLDSVCCSCDFKCHHYSYVYDEAGHWSGEYVCNRLRDPRDRLVGRHGRSLRSNLMARAPLSLLRARRSPEHSAARNGHVERQHSMAMDRMRLETSIPNVNPSGLGVFEYNLRFPGQQYDAPLGLHYNYFRDYDPAIGKYAESDPLGVRGGLNTYEYAFSSAPNVFDSTGLVPGPRPGYFRLVNCFGKWQSDCVKKCADRGGIYSCKVTKGAIGMPPKIYIVPSSWSCTCNDDYFCKKEPGACMFVGVLLVLGSCVAPEITIPILIRTAPTLIPVVE